jgi:hypothetical protein
MRLYLDDDSIGTVLVAFLRRAGHDVQMPGDVGNAGKADPVHLLHGIRQGQITMTMNHDDFKLLNELVLGSGGHHPGIFIVRKDNDPSRDMSPRGIVNAIAKYEATGLPAVDEFIILNHWR